jgi:hypothetical protein
MNNFIDLNVIPIIMKRKSDLENAHLNNKLIYTFHLILFYLFFIISFLNNKISNNSQFAQDITRPLKENK